MKNSETLIEKLAHRRADAEVASLPVSKVTSEPLASAPLASSNEFKVNAPQVQMPEIELEDFPEPEQARGGWRSWLLALGVVLLGFWMFTSVVGSKSASSSSTASSKASAVNGAVIREAAPIPKAPVVTVPMSDSAPAPVTASTSAVPMAIGRTAPERQVSTAQSSAAVRSLGASAGAKRSDSTWKESTSPLPTYNEANDGSIDRSPKAFSGPVKSPALVLPAPAASVEKMADACASLGGLAAMQCRRCDSSSAIAKPFCREQTRLEYCKGHYGKTAECPLVGYANGF